MLKCFPPIYDENSRILILGSFPSIKSLERAQYYGNPQNRFWRIIFAATDEAFTDDYEEKKTLLKKHGIALWETIAECEREGSMDSSIKNAVKCDIAGLIARTGIRCIILNGGKAKACFDAKTPADVYFLPSTSPANARMSLDALTQVWQDVIIKYKLRT